MSSSKIHDLFAAAIAKKSLPGAQVVVFNKDSFLVNEALGFSSLPSDEHPDGVLMTPESVHWIASAGKPTVSLLALIILERGLAPNGMTLGDLDNHEKLVQILPEFKHGSGSLVTKIIEGFERHLDADGRKIPILRDAKNKVTLRMLLTHTAGLSYAVRLHIAILWMTPLIRPISGTTPSLMSWYGIVRFQLMYAGFVSDCDLTQCAPKDGSIPLVPQMSTGAIDAFVVSG